MLHVPSKLASIGIVAGVMLLAACGETTAPTGPSLMAPSRPLALITTTTTWDFVALSGVSSDLEIGASRSYTNALAGTIVASAEQTLPTPGVVQLYAKGINELLGDEEKGLGFCYQPAGLADECTTTGEDEIGDSDGNGAYPSVILNFTGLSAGTVVTGVMMSSLQALEAYTISSSTDGVTWLPFASGIGSDAAPFVTVPVTDASIKYLRFEVGDGGAGNNYLLAAVTTATEQQPVCEDKTATNYGGPLPCVYPPKGNGCTPGYWKQKQHFDSWIATGLNPTDLIGSVFSGASLYSLAGKQMSAYKLVDGLAFKGGSDLVGATGILLRAAIAAELNSRHNMGYPMTASDIVTAVNNALASGSRATILGLATTLDNNNNLGCQLN